MAATSGVNLFRHAEGAVVYRSGDTIFAAGDEGDCLYAVKSGEVDLVFAGRVLETTGPGGLFGEMALIEREPRTATAVARTECEVVPIDEKRFRFLVQQTPMFALEVLRVMSRRLRKANEQ